MMNIKGAKLLFIAAIICTFMSSCGVSRIGEQVEIIGVEAIELKGLSAVELTIGYANHSKYDLQLNGGEVELYVGEQHIMKLTQIGTIAAEAKSEGSIKTLWRIGGVNPLTLLAYSKRFMAMDFTGVSADYSVELKANKLGKKFSGKGVDLTEFMTIFAGRQAKKL